MNGLALFRPPLKHPYKHPYGIAPCFPGRLKRAQSTQVGSHDTEILRIRYAVPPQYVVVHGVLIHNIF